MPFHRGFPVLGDLELTADGRDFVLVSGREKVAQSIRMGCQIFLGSWRYDRTKGLPYFQEILVAGPSLELVRRRFHDFLSATDGVTAVQNLTVRIEGSTLYVDFRVICADGDIASGTLDFIAAS